MNWDSVITIFLLLLLFYIIYTKVKGNTLRETWEEITDLFTGGNNE